MFDDITTEIQMNNWMSGIRAAILMILLWVVGWSVGFGGLIEAFVDREGDVIDIWFTSMAIPGFIGGVVFSVLLRIAEGTRRIDEIPLVRMAVWGAVTGLVIGTIAMVKG